MHVAPSCSLTPKDRERRKATRESFRSKSTKQIALVQQHKSGQQQEQQAEGHTETGEETAVEAASAPPPGTAQAAPAGEVAAATVKPTTEAAADWGWGDDADSFDD